MPASPLRYNFYNSNALLNFGAFDGLMLVAMFLCLEAAQVSFIGLCYGLTLEVRFVGVEWGYGGCLACLGWGFEVALGVG